MTPIWRVQRVGCMIVAQAEETIGAAIFVLPEPPLVRQPTDVVIGHWTDPTGPTGMVLGSPDGTASCVPVPDPRHRVGIAVAYEMAPL